MVQAYAMLANHGVKMPLSLYKLDEPPKGEQLLEPKIADQVLLMMEQVTLPGGTARQANIPGYRVAGKTGTAHKLRADRKGYSSNEYRALFSGVAPVSDPDWLFCGRRKSERKILWRSGGCASICQGNAGITPFDECAIR